MNCRLESPKTGACDLAQAIARDDVVNEPANLEETTVLQGQTVASDNHQRAPAACYTPKRPSQAPEGHKRKRRRSKAELEYGFCRYEKCQSRFLLNRSDKEFCKPKCRYLHHNAQRTQLTRTAFIQLATEEWATVAEAEQMGIGSKAEIRRMIRRKTISAVRVFGRVLLNRREITRLIEVDNTLLVNCSG